MKNLILNSIKSFIACIFIIIANPCQANQEVKESVFKSLKHNNSNMRLGPGQRFEIKWNFKKIGLPIKIIQKYESWYEVETPDGSKGWMLDRLLSKKKTVIFKTNSSIYQNPNTNSKLMATISKNSVVKIKSCKNNWCKIENEKYNIIGYVLKTHIWGAIVSETK